MFSWLSFSQTDTTKILFPTKYLKFAAKELISLDECKEEKKILYSNIYLLNDKINKKDTIIFKLDKLDKNNIESIILFEKKESKYISNEVIYKKQISSLKWSNLFWKSTTGLAILSTLYIVLK